MTFTASVEGVEAMRMRMQNAVDKDVEERRKKFFEAVLHVLMWALLVVLVLLVILLGVMVSEAQASGRHYATLRWNPVTVASSYRVYRATASGGPYALLTAVNAPPYRDDNVKPNRTYYYVVTAYCNSCAPRESEFSNVASTRIP